VPLSTDIAGFQFHPEDSLLAGNAGWACHTIQLPFYRDHWRSARGAGGRRSWGIPRIAEGAVRHRVWRRRSNWQADGSGKAVNSKHSDISTCDLSLKIVGWRTPESLNVGGHPRRAVLRFELLGATWRVPPTPKSASDWRPECSVPAFWQLQKCSGRVVCSAYGHSVQTKRALCEWRLESRRRRRHLLRG